MTGLFPALSLILAKNLLCKWGSTAAMTSLHHLNAEPVKVAKRVLGFLGDQRLHIDDLGFYHLFVLTGKPSTYVFLQVFIYFLNFYNSHDNIEVVRS